jgi:pyruvate formate lyase activating enzyme
METATFAAAVQHRDAVERKPLYHFRPGAEVLTLAAPGCTLRCDYCQNWRLSQFGRDGRAGWGARPVSPEEVVAAALAQGVGVIGLSYSEPGLAAEFSLALGELAAARGIELIWKSNGFLSAVAVEAMAGVLAAVNIDLKGVDPVRHRRLTGADPGPIREAIAGFVVAGVWVEVSTPLIPGVNDGPVELGRIAAAIAAISPDIPWHLGRFVPEYRLADLAPTADGTFAVAMAAGRAAGLRFVYTERVYGDAGRRTSCPGCGEALVSRRLWGLRHNGLRGGLCPRCNYRIPGRWAGTD